MEQLFQNLYDYFQKHRGAFWIVFAGAVLLLAWGASRIRIEEDITRFFPDDERVEKLNYVFRNARFAERLVFMVSVKDSTTTPEPDSLVAFTQELAASIDSTLKPHVTSVVSQVDDRRILELIGSIRENLPLFLDDQDYTELDSMIRPEKIGQTLENNYRQLIAPSGIVTKKIIVNDPLGFSYLALRKLQQLQYDKNIEVYNGYLLSRDHRHLIFFIQPAYRPNETGKNAALIEGLNAIVQHYSARHPQLMASYFGAAAVASGNAQQLQRDTIITLSLMVVLLAVVLVGYFRRKRAPLLILLPVAFGGLFSLCCVYLIQGSISVIAIAAGSIILGIAVNYSLHFLAHLKHVKDIRATIRDLVKPMTLGSTTTVLAFLCLQFVNAAVLRDVGLFAAFSLIGAALCSLIFLPQLPGKNLLAGDHHRVSWVERLATARIAPGKWVMIVILVLTPVFFYFAQHVSFNADLSQLNYMTADLRTAQQRLEHINRTSLTSLYVVSQARDLQHALGKNERTVSLLDTLLKEGKIQKFSSVSTFLVSDSLQRMKIARWNAFWDTKKKNRVIEESQRRGSALGFSPVVFQNLAALLNHTYVPGDTASFHAFRNAFFNDYLIEENGLATVITLVTTDPSKKAVVYQALESTPSDAFDRQMLTNLFAEYVHTDFNFIVAFTSVLVFVALLISYGRIELTLITFVPMFITWIWILGIMALAGIEFNIVNVMISTFIFGLGDDYSIFIMDGLQQEYKLARKNLPSIRTSILLSALTTISGLGVLIVARHPALRSIAGISIIGIVCVFVMSQTVEPFLFRWLITNRTSRGLRPMTFFGILKTIFAYGFFVFGSFFLTIIGLVLRLIPVGKGRVKVFYHILIRSFTRALMALTPRLPVTIEGLSKETFSTPAVIVSNHSSFLDILLTTMLHPKVILLTNRWVWNSPVFGGVVRLADYYPVSEGAEESVEPLKRIAGKGYSIVVFPEGSRSVDGAIRRFHKGAFFIAEALQLPVRPLVIHGAGDVIPKNTLYLNSGGIAMKFLPPILPKDLQFGETYAQRTKTIGRYFREEHRMLAFEARVPANYRYKLISNYLYKGPVLEWYLRIKLNIETNYKPFNDLVPARARVLDLGCGYGFLCYMLHFLSAERDITGVDYDEEKIEVAQHCYSRNERIRFITGDVTAFDLEPYDVIIIADVLHYLLPVAQESVIRRAIAALTPGGRLIIREGNTDLEDRHRGTRLTEFFSVKLLKFNKSVNTLHFVSGETITRLAEGQGCRVRIMDDTKFTSNVIFVVEKP